MASPNILAYLMLFVWPMLSWQMWNRLDPARALIWTVLGGYLIMPPLTVINFPIIPDLDKTTIPNLIAWYCALYVVRDKISFLPEGRMGKALILMYILSPFATVLTNTDALYFGAGYVQGMKIYDSAAAVANQFIALLPFFLARRYLGTPEGMRAVLEALVLAGLWYSVPMLIEARFSPQMNVWVYGFFQHDFFQTIRQGGYRPVVFLPHGLWVAFFALMCLLAALVRLRDTPAEVRPKALVIVLYLAFMLYICKSAGVVVYALCFAPLLLLASWRVQVLVAGVLALVVISYPILRGLHLVPLQQILDFANGFSADRAGSLQFRFDNEEELLARAQEKSLFGWGGYGRAFLHDPITGQMTAIADGYWVIVMGTYGWLGFIAEFGLTGLPLLILGREALSRFAPPFSRYTAGLALILAANMVDLLPNATHIPFTWLMAGGLLGEAERMRRLRLAESRAVLRGGLKDGKQKRTVI
ncbi:hypothetical protein [Cypionkella psychrotolerans]|uniref:hypothetical protein n=1 Tax=Cypionkella psychrotolerans TaxID=1678131 RepID=UPI000AB37938|nr:hypothetical protein [Cypionkella psychrotolerans]